jgi:hypothetical protein
MKKEIMNGAGGKAEAFRRRRSGCGGPTNYLAMNCLHLKSGQPGSRSVKVNQTSFQGRQRPFFVLQLRIAPFWQNYPSRLSK